jgi:hypothetical protein
VLCALTPDKILAYKDSSFIPKDKHPPTRNEGSWVCVCTGSALMMVNAFVQLRMGNEFPSFSSFTLQNAVGTNCLTDLSGCTDRSEPDCVMCVAAAKMHGWDLVAMHAADKAVADAAKKAATEAADKAAADKKKKHKKKKKSSSEKKQ